MSFLNELLAFIAGTAAAVLVYSLLLKRHLRKIEREWEELQQRRPAHNPFQKERGNEPHHVKHNVYHNPAKCGLQPIFELSQPDMRWAYNQMLLFRHRKSGRLFYVSEEGGSWPDPFEDHHFSSPDNTSLTEITPGDSWTSFLREVDSFPIDHEARTNMIETAGFYLSQRPQHPIS